jgi:iron complex outermembrane recepter protein
MKFLPSTSFALAILTGNVLLAQTDSIKWIPEVQIQATRVGDGSAVPHNNLSHEQINAAAEWRDMPYVLSSLPSVVETSDAGAGVGYTGLRIRGSDASRINITLNGIPFNDAESQGVFWVNMPDIASSASNIQVQRGVGASTNGAGAFGASVHLDLNHVPQDAQVRAQVGSGSFGTKKLSIILNSGLRKGGWYSGARWSGLESDGFIDRSSAHLRGMHLQAGRIGARSSLNAHLLHGNERTYQAWYGLPQQYAEKDAFYRFNPAGTEKQDSPYANETDNYTQTHALLHYKYQLTPALALQLNGHYTRGKGYYEQYKADEELSEYQILLGDSILSSDLVRRLWLDNHFFGSTWLLRHKSKASNQTLEYGGGLHIYLGEHYGRVIQVISKPSHSESEYYRNSAQKTDFNHFVRFQHGLGQKIQLNYDVQHRFVAYQFVGPDRNSVLLNDAVGLHFINPKASITYQKNSQQEFYLFTGIGHREPNRDDYTNSSPESRPKAERLYNLETGWKLEGKKFIAKANSFLMYYKNQLVLNGKINDVGAYTRINVPNSYRLGLELEAESQISKNWLFTANLTLSDHRIRHYRFFIDDWDNGGQNEQKLDRAPIAYSPRVVSRQAINWSAKWKRDNQIQVQLSHKYVGSQHLDNTGSAFTKIEAWNTLDGQIQFSRQLPKYKHNIRFWLQVNNLLNRKYFSNGWAYRFTSSDTSVLNDPYTKAEFGNQFNQIGLFPQALRHYYAGIAYEFGG